MKTPFDLSLYLVLDPDLCRQHSMLETACAAVAGGVTMVQVRHKHASTAERIALARSMKDALRDTAALLVMNDDIEAAIQAGVDAVHIGQRVSALAGPGEVLVSRTVTDLVAGSGLDFEDRGEHDLKGVPGTWRLFAVTDESAPSRAS